MSHIKNHSFGSIYFSLSLTALQCLFQLQSKQPLGPSRNTEVARTMHLQEYRCGLGKNTEISLLRVEEGIQKYIGLETSVGPCKYT